jgi:hypothetical protein
MIEARSRRDSGVKEVPYALVRVRNFGEANRALFAASPVAQEMFTAVGAAINELGTTDMKKMAASASARAGHREETRAALRELLQRVGQLARTLRAEGRPLPAFTLPRSKSALALLTAGRQFAVDMQPFEAEFAGHGMSPAQIITAAAAFEAALNTQVDGRREHVATMAQLRELFAAATRSVYRLDLIVANDLHDNSVVQAQWKQLRHVEDPRVSRNGGNGDTESPAAAPVGPAVVPTAVAASTSSVAPGVATSTPAIVPPAAADDDKPAPQAA